MKHLTLVLFLSLVLFGQEYSARAVIITLDRTTLSSEIAGNILSIPKRNGASFYRGDTLVKIDCKLYEAQKKKIAIEQEITRLKLEKNRQLESYNSIGAFEVSISEQEYEKAKAQFEIVQINTTRCEIIAPYNGKVVEVKTSRFANVSPQQELLEIINSENLEAKLVVPSHWLNWVKKGQKLSLHVDETNETIKAKIKEIGATIDITSQTVILRAKILKPSKKILPGMSATARFE